MVEVNKCISLSCETAIFASDTGQVCVECTVLVCLSVSVCICVCECVCVCVCVPLEDLPLESREQGG